MADDAALDMFVVADRFGTFADHTSVITLGALHESLQNGGIANGTPVTVHPGLGIQHDEWADVRTALAGSDSQRVATAGSPARKMPATDVLKLDQSNVLLADLRATGPRTFRAELIVSQDTEMILDHTAERQHIPGMLLMEACCQLLIAATGRFLDEQRPGRGYYAVMQHFEIEFRRFVFPLPAHLELTIESWDEDDDTGPSFTVRIDISQAGSVCSRARWRYRAFPPDHIFAVEARQADRAITAHRQAISATTGE